VHIFAKGAGRYALLTPRQTSDSLICLIHAPLGVLFLFSVFFRWSSHRLPLSLPVCVLRSPYQVLPNVQSSIQAFCDCLECNFSRQPQPFRPPRHPGSSSRSLLPDLFPANHTCTVLLVPFPPKGPHSPHSILCCRPGLLWAVKVQRTRLVVVVLFRLSDYHPEFAAPR